MQAHHDPIYKKALLDAIKDHDLTEANDAISFCLSKDRGREKLASDRDQVNRTYLSYALECEAIDIAYRLYELIGDEDSVLFNVDRNHRSLLWHAIRYEDLAVKISKKWAESENQEYIWFLPGFQGVSTLHLAAKFGRNEILAILLSQLAKRPNAQEILRQRDCSGSTPLINAIRSGLPDTVRLLVEVDANWESEAFNELCKQPKERQLDIFKTLKKKNQAQLLQVYRSKVLSSTNNPGLTEIYFKCAGLYSLKALAAAHLERQADGDLELPITLTSRVDNTYLDVLRNHAPIYYQTLKLNLEKVKEKKKTAEGVNDVVFEAISPDQHSLFNQHVMVKDDTTLLTLITDMERLLATLQGIPNTYSTTYRVLAVAIPVLIVLSWAIPMAVLIPLGGVKGSYKTCEDGLCTAVIAYGICGLVFLLGAIFTSIPSYFYLWKREVEPTISRDEWAPILGSLKENVINNLKRLEKAQKETSEPLLQVNEEVKSSLLVTADKLKHNQRVSQGVLIFRRLIDLVSAIRQEMNRTKRPLSLLFADQDVDLERGRLDSSSSPQPK